MAESPRAISERKIHLGVAGFAEWDEFAADPPESQSLEIKFAAEENDETATLFVRQRDVKQDWVVQLNGRRLGKLFLMEADLIHTVSVPPKTLRNGENVLTIFPGNPETRDDIVLYEISLDQRSPAQATSVAGVEVNIDDEAGRPLPCRITIVDANGSLAPIADRGSQPSLAVRPGVAYTATGKAQIGLRPGHYTIFASRGFEYGMAKKEADIMDGDSRVMGLRLVAEVPTPRLVSCDTHIHTFTHSRHGDATLEERMLTLAGEGIELPIATDHDVHVDYSEAARAMRVNETFTPVIGNEVTTRTGHFNIFPVERGAAVPDSRIVDWPQLMKAMRGTSGVRVIVLNHPRSIHTNFRPFDPAHFNSVTGDNERGEEFSFDALEILNSGAQQTDFMLVYRDWFALLNHGYHITAVGGSDSHDVSRFIVGQARTYIVAPDADPGRINVPTACDSILHGRAFVSMGLLTLLTVDRKFEVGDLATGLGENLRVDVTVLGPSWVQSTHVALFANGSKIREEEIKPSSQGTDKSGGEKARFTWSIARPRHDVHLVAIATGPAVSAPFWAMTKPYQPASPHWVGRAIGSTNPIWIDADGDGKFTAARGYAQQVVAQHGTAAVRLFPALKEFDEAVAAQAASICAGMGEHLTEKQMADVVPSASPQVAAGFSKYISAARDSANLRLH